MTGHRVTNGFSAATCADECHGKTFRMFSPAGDEFAALLPSPLSSPTCRRRTTPQPDREKPMPDPSFSSPEPGRPPAGADTSRAGIARVYDASLGGKDNFEADRQALDAVLEIAPGMCAVSRRNRAWLRRVLRYLAGVVGVEQ